jgi:hypothetical protein
MAASPVQVWGSVSASKRPSCTVSIEIWFQQNSALDTPKPILLLCYLWSNHPARHGRVELPITKHTPIIQRFPIFSLFIDQIEPCLCHWMPKLEGYKCSYSVRRKRSTAVLWASEVNAQHRKRMMSLWVIDRLLQLFKKK